jgi:cellulose synthase/poly-beta-1,6-N-acetylglucosamine synthase-like glycosyltransferase
MELHPIPLPGPAGGLPTAFALAAYTACQAAIVLYAAHRWTLVRRGRPAPPPPAPADWPHVTVQLPVYNEPLVIGRLIDAACSLDYPRDRLEVQVLDDSTDDTGPLAAAAVARWRARGVNALHLRRGSREGYKAGALAAGLLSARGELLAVFDADFVPAPDFLRRLVPRFADPRVGLVQARWGHLNSDRSPLTAAQATLLDAHFLLEHASRMDRGLFLNFNGTAGVWRRTCIEQAGGWSHDTLTEDLDLSYRAQLAGWKFVFDENVVVPAELPVSMAAFKSQQRRWVTGAIQTARKLLPAVWRSALPLAVKAEATIHLTSNVVYPLLLALGLLMLPVLLARPTLPPAVALALQLATVALGVLPVAVFLARGQRAAGLPACEVPGRVLAALVIGAGLSLANAFAVLEGLTRRGGEFVRTHKTGDEGGAPRMRAPWRPGRGAIAELALALGFAAQMIWAAADGQPRAVPFLALLAAGLAWVGTGTRPEPEPARR